MDDSLTHKIPLNVVFNSSMEFSEQKYISAYLPLNEQKHEDLDLNEQTYIEKTFWEKNSQIAIPYFPYFSQCNVI